MAYDLLQYAIGTVASAVTFFVGFEVNLGGALLDGVDKHFIDKANNGGFINTRSAFFIAFAWLLTRGDIDIIKIARVQIVQAVPQGILNVLDARAKKEGGDGGEN